MSARKTVFLLSTVVTAALCGGVPAHAAPDYWPHPPVQVSGPTPFAACVAPQVAEAILDSEVEPHLAVNPTDPAHLAAAWQQDRGGSGGSALGNVAAVSFDGGVTWQQGAIPSLTECSGGAFDYATDPWLAFTADGVLWAIALAWDDPPSDLHSLLVSRSGDGGLSWGDPVSVASGLYPEDWPDKEVILADPSDPDFVYVAFSRLDSSGGLPSNFPEGRSFFVRSTDGGVSWEPELLVHDPGAGFDLRGAQLFVLPDGTLVYLVRKRDVSVLGASFDHLVVRRSSDRGATWLPTGDPILGPAVSRGEALTPTAFTRIDGQSILFDAAVDPASGALYAVWQESDSGGIAHVAFSMSDDAGDSWSAPALIAATPVGSDPLGLLGQSYQPEVAVADDGTVGVTYDDFRNDVAGEPDWQDHWFTWCDPAQSNCTDPASWRERRVTRTSFDVLDAPLVNRPTGGGTSIFLGDYMGFESDGEDFLSLFVTASPDDPADAWFARIESARFQSKAQQQCIAELGKRGGGVVKASGRHSTACLKGAAKGKEADLAACLAGDANGKLAKAQAKTTSGEAKKCDPAERPDFAATDAATVNAAGLGEAAGLFEDLFGPDANAAVVLASADKAAAGCQGEVLKGAHKALDTAWKEFAKAERATLQGKKTEQAGTGQQLSELLAPVLSDGPKLTKALGKLDAKAAKKCGVVDTAAAFPGGCSAAAIGDVTGCAAERVRCRACAARNAAGALALPCDTLDDGDVNESC